MKKICVTLLAIIISFTVIAQVPQSISYQAIIRNSSNQLITNQGVGGKISILEDSISGTVIYSETHFLTANQNGLVSFEIGKGNVILGNFSSINWAKHKYFVKTEIDPTNIIGTNYTISSTSQLLSVPYALCAGSVSLSSPNGDNYNYTVDDYGNISFTKANASSQEKLIERLTYVFNNLESTNYVHSSDSLMNEYLGIYNYDCSGFVCEFAIKKCLSDHYQDLYNHKASSRPLAKDFYSYFRDTILGTLYDPNNIATCTKQNQYWEVFTDIDSLRKGDLIIVKYSEDWCIAENYSSTGHVMVAWGAAIQDSNNPDDYIIKIYDSSSSGHSNDSRDGALTASINGSGIGIGYMIFKASSLASHRPIQYKWNMTSTMYYKSYSTYYNSSDPQDERSHDRLEGIIFARPL